MMRTRSIFSIKRPPARADLLPACKHFFPCTETAGSTTLRDVIGGVVLKTNNGSADSEVTQAISKPDAYSIAVPLQSSNQKLVSGSWATIGTSTVTVLVIADFGLLGYFGFGDSNAGETEIMVRGNTVGPNMNDGSTNVISTACTNACLGAFVVKGLGSLLAERRPRCALRQPRRASLRLFGVGLYQILSRAPPPNP